MKMPIMSNVLQVHTREKANILSVLSQYYVFIYDGNERKKYGWFYVKLVGFCLVGVSMVISFEGTMEISIDTTI